MSYAAHKIEAGMIVHAQFPTNEGSSLPHYCLVMQVKDNAIGRSYAKVAYGTSKAVTNVTRLAGDFVIEDDAELAYAGLSRPTRFVCDRTATLPLDELKAVGRIDTLDNKVVKRLMRALHEVRYV